MQQALLRIQCRGRNDSVPSGQTNPPRSLPEAPWPVTFSPAEGRGGRSHLPLSGMFGSQRSKRSWFNHQTPG